MLWLRQQPAPHLEQVFEVLQSLRGLTSLQSRQKFRGKSSLPRTRSGAIAGFGEFFTSPWAILNKRFRQYGSGRMRFSNQPIIDR